MNEKPTTTAVQSIHQSIAGDKCLSCFVNKYVYNVHFISLVRLFYSHWNKSKNKNLNWMQFILLHFINFYFTFASLCKSFFSFFQKLRPNDGSTSTESKYIYTCLPFAFWNPDIDSFWMQLIWWQLMKYFEWEIHEIQIQVIRVGKYELFLSDIKQHQYEKFLLLANVNWNIFTTMAASAWV